MAYNYKAQQTASNQTISTDKIKSARCIFIYGTDAFQRDKYLRQIVKALDVSINDGMNTFLFYGDDYSKDDKVSAILDTLNMMSFDLSEKIVTIKHFEQLHKDAQTRIATYTKNPCDTSKLIIVSDKLDARTVAYKTLKETALLIETTEMKYTTHLAQWLNEYLKEHQLRMDEQTKNYFTTIVEPDAFTAYNEMKKLELYVGNTNIITLNDLKECTISSKAYTVFDLIDAVGYKQKEKALKILENLINNDESIIMVISLLTNFFFTLWRLEALKRRNYSSAELTAKHMNDINPYFREKHISFLKNYDQAQIQNAIKQLYICDSRAKLTMATDMVLGTQLVVSFFLV
jgi:DNA polymerase-3 subunit delta